MNINKLTAKDIERMPYVQFMALLSEVNRPPGGKMSIRQAIQNGFINHRSKVLDVGCNTGYCSFEIAHLAKCKVTGIDISADMIRVAKQYQSTDPLGHLVNFLVVDGMKMPFKDEFFDVVFSGGSTAFIDNKQKAVKEYTRVAKPWGFVIDINFFYHRKPPMSLINKLNNLLGIAIKSWGLDYWICLYKICGLEQYYIFTDKVRTIIQKDIKQYCSIMAGQEKFAPKTKSAVYQRLMDSMKLFNENHEYLSYGVFVNRKRPIEEQITLFDQ